MKKIVLLFGFVLVLIGSSEAKNHFKPHGNLGVFYSSLSPYGEWIQLETGFVWRPLHVNQGWRPYLYGRWVWSDYGWYWVSNEPFGWAAFHYGRWLYDNYYGWIWIPDDVWGPSWVEWRYDDDYIGWAPLTPHATFSINIGITFGNHWVSPVHYWNFIPCRYFTTTRVVDYIQPMERSRRIFGKTRSTVNIEGTDNRIINRGVDVRTIEQRTNVRINRIEVVPRDQAGSDRMTRRGGNDRIETYRPPLDKTARDQQDRPVEFRHDERRSLLNRDQVIRTDKENRTTNRTSPGTRLYERNSQRNDADRETQNRRLQQERSAQKDVNQGNENHQEEQRRFYERRQQQREQTVEQHRQGRELQENNRREQPRLERKQSQPQQRSQPTQRQDNARSGGREGRRKP